jgi:hypothetical protein
MRRQAFPSSLRFCDLCGRRYQLHRLTRVSWAGPDDTEMPAGTVCADCWLDLPTIVVINGEERWQLVGRAH